MQLGEKKIEFDSKSIGFIKKIVSRLKESYFCNMNCRHFSKIIAMLKNDLISQWHPDRKRFTS